MPLFEYRCATCGHLEEVLQKHGEPAPDPCPACGRAATMSKEVSLTSFQLKGGGWYKDLYSSTPKDGGKSDGGSKTETKSDTSSSPSSSDGGAKKDTPKKADGGSSSGASGGGSGGASSGAGSTSKASSAAAA